LLEYAFKSDNYLLNHRLNISNNKIGKFVEGIEVNKGLNIRANLGIYQSIIS